MKRNRFVAAVFAFVCAVVLIAAFGTKGIPVHAVEAGFGSLGSVEGIDDDVLEQAEEYLDDIDVDLEFEENYSGLSYRKCGFTRTDLKYMSCIIYCEANSMSFDAKAAVGNVVLNRMYDRRTSDWGHVNTIKEVIYDRKWGVQFSPIKGSPSSMDKALALYKSMDPDEYKDWQIRAMTECIEVAKAVLSGYRSVPTTYMYFNAHIDTTKAKCKTNGWTFRVMEGHIYYNDEPR